MRSGRSGEKEHVDVRNRSMILEIGMMKRNTDTLRMTAPMRMGSWETVDRLGVNRPEVNVGFGGPKYHGEVR